MIYAINTIKEKKKTFTQEWNTQFGEQMLNVYRVSS